MRRPYSHGMTIGIPLEFGYRVIYDVASKPKAKVEFVLREKVWIWKPTRLDDLVTLLTTSFGCYSCDATYNEIRVERAGGGLVEESLVSASYSWT